MFSFEKGIGKVVNKRKLQDDDPTMGNSTIEGGGETGKDEGGETGKEEGGETGKDEGGETGKDEGGEFTEEEELSLECNKQLDNTTCLSLELNTKDYHCCFITYNQSETKISECILNTDKEIYTESSTISDPKIDCFSWKLMPSLFLILLSLVIFN